MIRNTHLCHADLRRRWRSGRSTSVSMWKFSAMVLALTGAGASQAVDFGPDGMFSLTGFAEATLTRTNNQCKNCQFDPDRDRQRIWTDDVVPGRPLKRTTVDFTQIQPYLGVKYDIGRGFTLSGLLSQRWRDGKVDVKGFEYEKNVAISHEDYGSLRIGAMTTRAWSLTDYPYSSQFGMSNAFANTGAGYGLLTQAVRYTSRVLDVAEGDLVLEATYDRGDTDFKVNKPRFFEVWLHYGKGDLTIDAMMQDTRNGGSVAWGHAPFKGPAFDSAADSKIGGSGQAVALILGRYKINPRIEVTGGVRRNRWSGANALVIDPGTGSGVIWNNMFNVDWGGTRDGIANPGYSATSVDLIAGAIYRVGKWEAATGVVYLGKANTANPSERGQSNTALVNTARLSYNFAPGLQLYSQAGMVHFKHQGLAPLSMPAHAAIQQIDSRVTKAGNWFAAGVLYSF